MRAPGAQIATGESDFGVAGHYCWASTIAAQKGAPAGTNALRRLTAFDRRTRPTLHDKAADLYLASDRIDAPSDWILVSSNACRDFVGRDHTCANDRRSNYDRCG
jgi:hypothetical protein